MNPQANDNKTATNKSVIIIGAGLAGLSAGVYGQLYGYHTRIFEHHAVPGGVIATWKRKAYTVEGGMHFLMGYRPGQPIYDLYEDLGIMPGTPVVPMTSYLRFFNALDGRSVELTNNLEKSCELLLTTFPDDAAVINDLFKAAKDIQGSSMGMGTLATAPELMTLKDHLSMYWQMRDIFKYFTKRYQQPLSSIASQVHDPWLGHIIQNLFLPEVPVWFSLMILGLLGSNQIGLLEEGSRAFAQAIEKRYADLGGAITYRATVKSIIVENDRAVGVRLEDDSEYRADAIISAGDGHGTIFDLLEGRYLDDKIKRRYETWKLMRPYFMVNLAVTRTFSGEPSFNLIRLEKPMKIGNHDNEALMTRIFNYTPKFAPEGHTVFQISGETDWDYWNNLREDRQAYEAEKERLAVEIVRRLEVLYPGLTSASEILDVATPYTTWRYTLNWRGAYEGWLPTADVILETIPRTLPGLSNFYMAGQWVIPGGGVPPCLYSGKHAIQIMCRDDGKRFAEVK